MKLIYLITTVAIILLPYLVSSRPLAENNDGNSVQQHHHEAKVKRQCIPNGAFYDDATYMVPIEYIGSWTHLSNQGNKVKFGTLSYTGQANA